MYTYIHTYLHTYIHTYIHTYCTVSTVTLLWQMPSQCLICGKFIIYVIHTVHTLILANMDQSGRQLIREPRRRRLARHGHQQQVPRAEAAAHIAGLSLAPPAGQERGR